MEKELKYSYIQQTDCHHQSFGNLTFCCCCFVWDHIRGCSRLNSGSVLRDLSGQSSRDIEPIPGRPQGIICSVMYQTFMGLSAR